MAAEYVELVTPKCNQNIRHLDQFCHFVVWADKVDVPE